MTTTEIPVDNGVNVEALLGVREALADTPEIAQFQWRSTVCWVNGTHSRSDVETFYGFGDEQQHHTTFNHEIDADASAEDIRALVAQSQKRSAVFDIVTNPTDVTVTVV